MSTAERTVYGWTRREVYRATEKKVRETIRLEAAQNQPQAMRCATPAGELLTEDDIEELCTLARQLGQGTRPSDYRPRFSEAQAFVKANAHTTTLRKIRERLHEFDLVEEDEDYLMLLAAELERDKTTQHGTERR